MSECLCVFKGKRGIGRMRETGDRERHRDKKWLRHIDNQKFMYQCLFLEETLKESIFIILCIRRD